MWHLPHLMMLFCNEFPVAVLTAVFSTIFIFGVGLKFSSYHHRHKTPSVNVPILNLGPEEGFEAAVNNYKSQFKVVLQHGYERFKDGLYQLWGIDGYLVIVSPKYVKELDALGTDVLDMHSASQKRNIGDYNWLQIADPLLFSTILTDLTRNLSSLLPNIRTEIEFALSSRLSHCMDWTCVTAWPSFFHTMALVVSLAAVGPDLNRNEAWLTTMIAFLDDIFIGEWELKGYHPLIRPLVARGFVPGIRRVWAHQASARRQLVPIITSRRDAEVKTQSGKEQIEYQKPNDILQWLMDNGARTKPKRTDANIAELALTVGFGAIHASTITLINVLFDLAAFPQYHESIREEWVAANLEHGENQMGMMNSLRKLDSFLKESQRLNPVAMTTFSRLVRKPVTLSNGTHLPVGTHILMPSAMASLDAEIYNTPEEFDGLRFYKRRMSASGEAIYKNQFTSTSPEQLHFGFGRQACPGRFFGSVVIKAIVGHVLEMYDLRLVDHEAGRPPNIMKGGMSFPDKGACIMVRKRDV